MSWKMCLGLVLSLLWLGSAQAGTTEVPCGAATGKPCRWNTDLLEWSWATTPDPEATGVEICCGPPGNACQTRKHLSLAQTRVPLREMVPGRGVWNCTGAPVGPDGVGVHSVIYPFDLIRLPEGALVLRGVTP